MLDYRPEVTSAVDWDVKNSKIDIYKHLQVQLVVRLLYDATVRIVRNSERSFYKKMFGLGRDRTFCKRDK